MASLENSNQRPVSLPTLTPDDESHSSDFENDNFAMQSIKKRSKITFKCLECKDQFSSKGNLKRHFLRVHPEKEFLEPVKNYKFPCDACSKGFNNAKYLRSHQRGEHGMMPAVKKLHSCYICYMEFDYKSLLTHYEMEHNINLSEEALSFPTFEEAIKWKESEENSIKCKFIVNRGMEESGGRKHYSYKCHRSGYFNSRSAGIRRLKTQGSRKMNFLCPSSIKIIVDSNGNCAVKYTKTHVGHAMELKHMQLSASERQSLAEKLAMKIPFNTILDNVRESISNSGLERLHLVTKQDLRNIESSYQLTSIKHADDATSVDMWIQEMNESTSDSSSINKALTNETIEIEKMHLEKEYIEIIRSSNKKQLELIKKTLSHLKVVLPTLEDEESSPTPFPTVSRCLKKNIEPQKRFTSKKRKLKSNMMPSSKNTHCSKSFIEKTGNRTVGTK